MTRYEYRVVPAPRQGEKARGAKTAEERLAVAVTALMNRLGAEGWEYLRSDTLPAEEKSGWMRAATLAQHTLLVFRRPLAEAAATVAEPPAATAEPATTGLRAVPAFLRAGHRRETRVAAAEVALLHQPADTTEASGAAPRLGPARGD